MNNHYKTARRGFTMIELMIVIAIIGMMMTLAVGAMFSFIAGAREAATTTTISKVNEQLRERMVGFRQMDFTDAAQLLANQPNSISQGMSTDVAEILVRKFRQKRAFPQNLAELTNDPQRFSSLIAAFTSATPPMAKYQSGIILYAVLTTGETFGAPSVNDDLFTGAEILISTQLTAGLPCLVDGWGEPLRFYRWPTRLFKTSGNATPLSATFPIDRTFASLLVSSAGRYYPYSGGSPNPAQWYGTDGLPGANGVGGQGVYGSDDVPNVGPDGMAGVAGTGGLGCPSSDDYEPLSVDPDDPLLLLFTFLQANGLLVQFEQGSASGTPDLTQALHTAATYNPMLVVSAGPDRQLGLLEPNDNSANCGYLACPTIALNGVNLTLQFLTDNLSNLNLSSSGK